MLVALRFNYSMMPLLSMGIILYAYLFPDIKLTCYIDSLMNVLLSD